MKKKILALTMLTVASLALFGCGKKEEPVATTEEIATTEEETEEATTEEASLENYNELTGECVPGYTPHRPVACMINNLKEALPSSSTKKADVIVECMVEGGITRIMPIFSNYDDIEKLGSVRSARHYYINLATEFNAIFVCYGQSEPAKSILDKGVIDHINGMTDNYFYRVSDRVAPHNAYTKSELIKKGIEDKGISTDYFDNHEPVFHFKSKGEDLENGQTAETIHVNFSAYSKPYFVYNKDKGLYDRYEYGNPQVDEQADSEDNILDFENVLVISSTYTCINPSNDLQNLVQVGEGSGYYFSKGKAIPIKWKKADWNTPTQFYTEDGELLEMNPGKTWLSIIGDGSDASVTFE